MNKYQYTVWFRDLSLDKNDQDYEWPACIIINANNTNDAKYWGDYLSNKYCEKRHNELIIKSNAKLIDKTNNEDNVKLLPVINYGYEASDSEIGW